MANQTTEESEILKVIHGWVSLAIYMCEHSWDSGTQSFIGRNLWLYTLLVYWTAMTKSMKSVAETVLQ